MIVYGKSFSFMSPANSQKTVALFWYNLSFTGAALSALPSVKFITGLQYVISLINSIPVVLTPLLKGVSAGFGVVSLRLGWYGERD